MFVMYYIYGSARAIPTYRVYRLYDTITVDILEKCLYSAEWNGGMEWWNGTMEWNGMEWWNDHAHRERSLTTYTDCINQD
jgi:hypothetical protein